MSITKQSKPRQTRTTGSAASHRTEGKRRNDRHNYFYDVLYGNEGARENRWERKIKTK